MFEDGRTEGVQQIQQRGPRPEREREIKQSGNVTTLFPGVTGLVSGPGPDTIVHTASAHLLQL